MFVGQRILHQMCDFVGIEGLGHVIVSAILQSRHRRLDRSVSSHHNHDKFGIDLVHAALQLDSVGAMHFDIDQSGVPALFGQLRQRIVGVLNRRDLIAFFAKPFAQSSFLLTKIPDLARAE